MKAFDIVIGRNEHGEEILTPMLSKIANYFRLAFDLRGFLKETLTLEQCREIVRRRIEEREKNFLDIVERGIYRNEKSPYSKLLELAGCEFGDIRSAVLRYGIEETLQRLYESGVYLTYEEFKGRKDVVRAGKSYRFQASDFDNPHLPHHLRAQTGGSTGSGVSIVHGFQYFAQNAAHRALLFDVYRLWETPLGIWYPILPGFAGVSTLLQSTKFGKVPDKWFSQVDREYIRSSFKQKLRTNLLIYTGRIWGTPFPKPEFVDPNNAIVIAEWVAKMIRDFSGCCIATHPSYAVRICHAAAEKGLNIEGASFFVSGEPITPTKLREVQSRGAKIIAQYVFTEGGTVGYGCANPAHCDEIHFQKDCLAFIQHKRKIKETDLTVDAFLFTSLLSAAPRILLNVEIGDYGVVESRQCGCGFDDLGFEEHIHSIRSFARLNSEGLMLTTAGLVHLIEEVLPFKYGGNSTDYQIIEEEDKGGITRLNILVSPEVGEINEKDLLDTVIGEFKKRKRDTVKSDIFSQADTFHIKRIYPISTEMGKILPLRIERKKNSFNT